MTGNSGVATRHGDGQIHLQLPAGESLILRAFASDEVKGTAWNYWQFTGQPVEITGQWNVNLFPAARLCPLIRKSQNSHRGRLSPTRTRKAFAGTASYTTTFDAPDSSAGKNYFLDLGDVRQSARVRVNGKDYGTLITPPFRVVVDNLKPTGNTLEVEVTSVAANRIRDLDRRGVQWKIFKDINIVNVDYKPFDASNWPLTDCGLLGPVTLTAVTDAN
jgi:hypothetical protein